MSCVSIIMYMLLWTVHIPLPLISFVPVFQFVSSKVACIMEESVLDPDAKTLTTYTKNITFAKLMAVEEKCVFSVHSSNKEWWVFCLICTFLYFLGPLWKKLLILLIFYLLASLATGLRCIWSKKKCFFTWKAFTSE